MDILKIVMKSTQTDDFLVAFDGHFDKMGLPFSSPLRP